MTGRKPRGVENAFGEDKLPTPRSSGVPSESELQKMRDREVMEFIRQAVVELHQMGDRLERFAAQVERKVTP